MYNLKLNPRFPWPLVPVLVGMALVVFGVLGAIPEPELVLRLGDEQWHQTDDLVYDHAIEGHDGVRVFFAMQETSDAIDPTYYKCLVFPAENVVRGEISSLGEKEAVYIDRETRQLLLVVYPQSSLFTTARAPLNLLTTEDLNVVLPSAQAKHFTQNFWNLVIALSGAILLFVGLMMPFGASSHGSLMT